MTDYHIPVMLNETIDHLIQDPNGVYIDCTLGGGGHSSEVLKRLGSKGMLCSIDQDDEALAYASNRIGVDERIKFCKGNFGNMISVTGCELNSVDGILMDLGVSSHQIDSAERGFSFQQDYPLDMRMNHDDSKTAADIVNEYSESELRKIFFTYGEEKFASKISRFIIKRREAAPIQTTFELKQIIEDAIPRGQKVTKSFARIFQALRIEVNQEMKVLEDGLIEAYRLLKNNGRLVVLSYHSLEDRIVKKFMKSKKKEFYDPDRPMDYEQSATYFDLISTKPILPTDEEILINPRARSAKCRVAQKVIREVA